MRIDTLRIQASILEYDATDGRKNDALNSELPLMRPESLRFYHSALRAAQEELEAAYACFGSEERDAAALLARRSSQGESIQRTSSALRDQQIRRAIDTLPSTVGTALFRGDLQRTLDSAYEIEQLTKRRGG